MWVAPQLWRHSGEARRGGMRSSTGAGVEELMWLGLLRCRIGGAADPTARDVERWRGEL